MTVAELIDHLEDLPAAADVVLAQIATSVTTPVLLIGTNRDPMLGLIVLREPDGMKARLERLHRDAS